MAAETFHLFTELPRELRDMIWISAIRPSLPAAHIFSLLKPRHSSSYRVRGNRRHEHDIAIGAPTILSKAEKEEDWQLSWTVDNPSAYLIDSGLWTACKESREAMHSHFRTKFWAPKREEFRLSMLERRKQKGEPLHEYIKEAPDAPVTSCFHVDGENRIFTIRPKSDLIVLRPLGFYWWWHSVLHLYDQGELLSHHYGSQVEHIAIEVEDPFTSTVLYDFAKSMVGNPRIRGHLWVIDHCLERLPNADPILPDKSRHIFYGNGCRYVEYFEGDGGWTKPSVAHSLSHDIKSAAEDILSDFGYESDDWHRDNDRDDAMTALECDDHFGILACELLGMPEPIRCPTGGPNRLAKEAWERKEARCWTWREVE